MSGDMQMEEKSRTCPSCRCSISVLATKCRFCGETVGKPKVEIRQLTVNDLGGESVRHKAVSSNVISALDEMRKETGGSGFPGMEDVDGTGDGSADDSGIDITGLDQPSFRAHIPKVRKPSIGDRLMTAAKIIGVLVVIAFIAIKGPDMLKSDPDNPIIDKVYVNKAQEILDTDGDLMEAMRAAMEAKSEMPSAENDKMADKVLGLIIEDIEKLLNENLWDISKLKEASSLANEVAKIYPSSESNDIKSKVMQEFQDYNMFLLEVDPSAGTAIFQLITRNSPKVTVKRGQLVAGRFQVVAIESGSVQLKDTKRNNRILVCATAQGPR